MTEEQINIAIAEACGWSCIKERTEEHVDLDSRTVTHITGISGYPKGWDSLNYLPDYVNDLNAMHEAERSNEMHFDQRWAETIVEIAHRESVMNLDRTDGWDWILIVARLKPAQRAEAFLRTIGKWEEVQP